jgi:leucyl aminopeptidase
MDITDHQELGMSNALNTAARAKKTVTFPAKLKFVDDVKPMLEKLDKNNMKENLEKFTSFHTRYARSDYGRQSSEWLLSRINSTATYPIPEISVKPFPHSWQQSSIITRIPGKTNKTVVIGAHQDSINLFLPSLLAAPGADDDGSGTVTILEALRVLVASLAESGKTLQNTVEFHWYSAEELGMKIDPAV